MEVACFKIKTNECLFLCYLYKTIKKKMECGSGDFETPQSRYAFLQSHRRNIKFGQWRNDWALRTRNGNTGYASRGPSRLLTLCTQMQLSEKRKKNCEKTFLSRWVLSYKGLIWGPTFYRKNLGIFRRNKLFITVYMM